MRRTLPLLCGLTLLATLGLSSEASAHNVGQSYVFLKVYESSLAGRVEMNVEHANELFGTTFPKDGVLYPKDITPHIDKIKAYYQPRFGLKAPGKQPYTIKYTTHAVTDVGFSKFIQLDFEVDGIDPAGVGDKVEIFYDVLFDTAPDHKALLVVSHNWNQGTIGNWEIPSLSFSAEEKTKVLEVGGGSVMRGFITMIELGVEHIWLGIDHILFLIALIIPAVLRREEDRWVPVDSFRPALMHIVKIVTLFTVAHSITLSAAALEFVSLPSAFVESIIALSVGIAAFDILKPIFGKRIWLVVFAFGLFHGFGFASVLGEIGLGRENLGLSLLGFNVGVEIGQVVVIAVCFPVLYFVRNQRVYHSVVVRYAAFALIAVATVWLAERTLDVELFDPVIGGIKSTIKGVIR